MANIKYASIASLTKLVANVKSFVNTGLATKVSLKAGWDLSQNDLTNALKANYDAAYTHSQVAHAPANAERNTMVGVTVNGAPVTITPERIAAITVATKVSELTNDSKFQKDTEVSASITTALLDYYTKAAADSAIAAAVSGASHLKYEIVTDLPTTNISTTTIYMKKKAGTPPVGDIYVEYMYLNNLWEVIGDTDVDLTAYSTTAQMNTAIANAVALCVKTTEMVAITDAEVDALFA